MLQLALVGVGYILKVNIALFVLQTAIASRVTCRVLAMDLRGHGEPIPKH